MAIDFSTVQNPTDAQLLAISREALACVMLGKAYTIGGRSVTREDAKQIRDTITWLETRIQDDANALSGGSVALVQFNDTSAGS